MAAPLHILMVADGNAGDLYGDALADAFISLGHTVTSFTWQDFFHRYPYRPAGPSLPDRLRSVWFRAQNKYTFGPAIWRLNRALLAQGKHHRPDLVFIYRGTHIWPSAVKTLRKLGCPVFGYNNDDPFSRRYPRWFWRHFRKTIPFYSHLFAYRESNLTAFRQLGAQGTSLLRAYYRKSANFRLHPPPSPNTFSADIIFIGHFEDDGRDQALKLLIDHGIDLKLYGTGWEKSALFPVFTRLMQGPIQPLRGADYNLALNSAKIALVFLSKLNNDTYTRRCFEIPAAGACMLAEYTNDLASNLFTPDQEAVYFSSSAELLSKVQQLLAHDHKRQSIAAAGHARLLQDGHEATDRAREILSFLKS